MIASGEIKDARQSSYCSMLKLISSFKTIFLEFRNMNNQKKVFIRIVRYPLWSVNFVIATGIKATFHL
jgi:hypothetical protein